nr:hypothetical protein [Bradyrhizobium sp. CCBAU 51627]
MVWAKLNDPAVQKSCIPGYEQLIRLKTRSFAPRENEGRVGLRAVQGQGYLD